MSLCWWYRRCVATQRSRGPWTAIEPNTAKEIHQLLVWPVIGTFVVHFLLNLYFALRRWRVIRWKAS